MSEQTSRRTFLQPAAAGAGLLILKPETAFGYQANSALNVGIIGVGGRGTYVGGIFARQEFARIGAICDIYDDKIKAGQEKFQSAKVFRNHNDLLASDVDAVYIATPAYLHPEHFEAAVKARKHIFCEKPAGVDVAGAQRILKASGKADPTKRISFDYQQRYGRDYNEAHKIVTSGELGPVRMVRAAWIGGGPQIKKGHAPSEEKVRNWFFYRELSGDILVEQDCHNLDVVNWFMGKTPVSASGYGFQSERKYGDIFDTLTLSYKFDDGRVFSYSASQVVQGYQDVGEYFMCEKGTVHTSRQGYEVYESGKRQPTKVVQTKRKAEDERIYDITDDAVSQFVEGARTGKLENAAPWAVASTMTAILGLQAILRKKELTLNELSKG